MNTNMLVTVKSNSVSTIALQITDRIMGKSERFLIMKKDITEHLFEESRLIDTDIMNCISMYRRFDNTVYIDIKFISEGWNRTLTGHRRCFYLPVSALKAAIDGNDTKFLIDGEPEQSKALILMHNHTGVSLSAMPKKQHRAFVKAMRNNFNWGNSVVHLHKYDDDFDFTELDQRHGRGMRGGLVLHKTEVRGTDGKMHEKLYYSVHT